jgi:hypothetical protein
MNCVKVNAGESKILGTLSKQDPLNKLRKLGPNLISGIERMGLTGRTKKGKTEISNLLQSYIDGLESVNQGKEFRELWKQCEKDISKLDKALHVKMKTKKIEDPLQQRLADAQLKYEINRGWGTWTEYQYLEEDWQKELESKKPENSDHGIFIVDAKRDGKLSTVDAAWFRRLEPLVITKEISYTQGLTKLLTIYFGKKHPMTADTKKIKYIAYAWKQIVEHATRSYELAKQWSEKRLPSELIHVLEWLNDHVGPEYTDTKKYIDSILEIEDKPKRNSGLKEAIGVAIVANFTKYPILEKEIRDALDEMYNLSQKNEKCAETLTNRMIKKLQVIVNSKYSNHQKIKKA